MPQMRLYYLRSLAESGRSSEAGFLVRTYGAGYNIGDLLEAALLGGGDYGFSLLAHGGRALHVTSADGEVLLRCTAWDFGWRRDLSALLKIQRYVRRRIVFWKMASEPFRMRVLGAFRCSVAVTRVPCEIVAEIILPMYLCCSWKGFRKHPIRRVQAALR